MIRKRAPHGGGWAPPPPGASRSPPRRPSSAAASSKWAATHLFVKKCSLHLNERVHIDAVFFFITSKPYTQGLPLWQVLEKVGVPGVWQQIARDEQSFKAHASAADFMRPQLEPPKETPAVYGAGAALSVDRFAPMRRAAHREIYEVSTLRKIRYVRYARARPARSTVVRRCGEPPIEILRWLDPPQNPLRPLRATSFP